MSVKYAIAAPSVLHSDLLAPTFRKKKHYHVFREEFLLLKDCGAIEPLDEKRRIWRYVGCFVSEHTKSTGAGELSLAIPRKLFDVMKSSMTHRPIDEPMEAMA